MLTLAIETATEYASVVLREDGRELAAWREVTRQDLLVRLAGEVSGRAITRRARVRAARPDLHRPGPGLLHLSPRRTGHRQGLQPRARHSARRRRLPRRDGVGLSLTASPVSPVPSSTRGAANSMAGYFGPATRRPGWRRSSSLIPAGLGARLAECDGAGHRIWTNGPAARRGDCPVSRRTSNRGEGRSRSARREPRWRGWASVASRRPAATTWPRLHPDLRAQVLRGGEVRP